MSYQNFERIRIAFLFEFHEINPATLPRKAVHQWERKSRDCLAVADVKPIKPQETLNSHILQGSLKNLISPKTNWKHKWNKSTTLLLTLAEVLISCASALPQAVHHGTGEQAFQGHHVISGHVAVKPSAWIGWGLHVDGWVGPHVLLFLTSYAPYPCLTCSPIIHVWAILLSFKIKLFYFSISMVLQLFPLRTSSYWL